MTDVVWLASYPKSGNTWLRMLVGCLSAREGEAVDINATIKRGGMASGRTPFDNMLLIDSGLLTHDEIDCLRPRLYEELARGREPEDDDEETGPVRFVKAHDAYTLTPDREPLLAGARGAKGAIVIVRDPRDVAPSLANHNRSTIDAAIAFMNDAGSDFCGSTRHQPRQLRQKLLGWSTHVASWLDQRDIPIHLLRYEDIKRDTVGSLRRAMEFAGQPVSGEAAARAAALASFSNLQAQERATGFSEWRPRGAEDRLFFRRGEAGAWRQELTAQQVESIESVHAPMMRRLGYELSPVYKTVDAAGSAQ